MSEKTKIQWCDTTVNPIMGCGGCELFPTPGEVLAAIDTAAAEAGVRLDSKRIYKELVDKVFLHSENPHVGHKQAVNVTNIYHLRKRFAERVREQHGAKVAKAADNAIRKAVTCYAATLHLRWGANILHREGNRPGKDEPSEKNSGYAPIFEMVTRFEGRSEETAALADLLGQANPETPWKGRLPRLIFVSDMGDALSAKGDFAFLKKDLMPAITSEAGQHHLWLWLTKRAGRMAEFAEEIGGFPSNVCAMTTLTGPDGESLKRLAELKTVKAAVRGLSIEPLWERIPPSKLNLRGIDWVIVGGESGNGALTREFALEWAEELRDHCRKHGVAFFLKQLGRNPSRGGKVFKLKDTHGGNWDEWDESLRIREFPKAFHEYRREEMIPSEEPRPMLQKKKRKAEPEFEVTEQERTDFKRLDTIVRRAVKASLEGGKALAEIKARNLWRAGGHGTWEAYCREVAGLSKSYAHRLTTAAQIADEIAKRLPIGNPEAAAVPAPITESQVRPLVRIADPDRRAEIWVEAVKKTREAGACQPTANEVQDLVFEVLERDAPGERPPSRAERRAGVFKSLRAAFERGALKEAERLLAELEALL